jgi:hypothetical protein
MATHRNNDMWAVAILSNDLQAIYSLSIANHIIQDLGAIFFNPEFSLALCIARDKNDVPGKFIGQCPIRRGGFPLVSGGHLEGA